MMRPMFVEFPEDRACEPLDKQYMLGDSLLVAPVFKESGEVEYYLPEGVWVNLLTGTTVKGGRWQKETHDYFSLPLMVRPGSIVAVGQESSRPDYDFADGVRFLLWLPEEWNDCGDRSNGSERKCSHDCVGRQGRRENYASGRENVRRRICGRFHKLYV